MIPNNAPAKQGLVLMLVGLFLSCALAARADLVTPQQEIAHLMDFIAASDCRFIRNGRVYDAQTAREHIQRKYDYLRSRIRTAEDFIRYAASGSSMSGEPYRVACGDRSVPCAEWLREALARFRRQAGTEDGSVLP